MQQEHAEDDGIGRRTGNTERQGGDEAAAHRTVVGRLRGDDAVDLTLAERLGML